jgi:hypothetical protein
MGFTDLRHGSKRTQQGRERVAIGIAKTHNGARQS